MNAKILTGAIGLALLIAFIAPPIIKLQKLALALVALVTLAMAAYEFYENVRGKDD